MALAIAATSLAPVLAGAAPIDDRRAQAQELEGKINATAEQLAALNEQIKGVQDQVDEANATIADAETRIAAAQAEVVRVKELVRQRAAAVYRSASSGGTTDEFNVGVSEITARRKYADAASQHDDLLLFQLAQAKEDLAVRQHDAAQAKQGAEAKKAELDGARADFQAQNAEHQKLLDQVNGEIAQLVAEEQAKRVAAQAPKPTGGAVTFDPGKIPPASGKGGTVVAFVSQALGTPYCYAGVGPGCYDCSGLTQQAWAAAGIYLPHNSEAQLGGYPRVPMNALQPGDIVWSPGHVGIYVGGGAVIHAPHTGDVVRYMDVSYYSAAVRPG
jgi:cell wall-associated NlpC family hydrolase